MCLCMSTADRKHARLNASAYKCNRNKVNYRYTVKLRETTAGP